MTTATPALSVGQIAAGFPASVPVFEKHGIDFCCGGKISVTEACGRKGLDPALLLDEIDLAVQTPVPDATDWLTAPLPVLIDHILDTHHAYMKVQLPRVEAMLAKVSQAHGERHGDLLREVSAVYGPMKAELDGHLAKEEMILFPLVRALDGGAQPGAFHCGGVQNPIRVMLMEHDSAGEALVQLRRLTDDYTPPRTPAIPSAHCTSNLRRWSATCTAIFTSKTTSCSRVRSRENSRKVRGKAGQLWYLYPPFPSVPFLTISPPPWLALPLMMV